MGFIQKEKLNLGKDKEMGIGAGIVEKQGLMRF
jgi:hypothetical protein